MFDKKALAKQWIEAGNTAEELTVYLDELHRDSQHTQKDIDEKREKYGVKGPFPKNIKSVYNDLLETLYFKEMNPSEEEKEKQKSLISTFEEEAYAIVVDENDNALTWKITLFILTIFGIPLAVSYFFLKTNIIWSVGSTLFLSIWLLMSFNQKLLYRIKKRMIKNYPGVKEYVEKYVVEKLTSKAYSDKTFVQEEIFRIVEYRGVPFYATWDIQFENHCLNRLALALRYAELRSEGKTDEVAFAIVTDQFLTPQIDPSTGDVVYGTTSIGVIEDTKRMLQLLRKNNLFDRYISSFVEYAG